MKDKKITAENKDEQLLDEYYSQVEENEEIHTHVDYSDSYGDSGCC